MPAVAIDRETREALEGLIARMDLDTYVSRVERALADMPEYRDFVDGAGRLDDRGRAGIRANLETFLRWVRDGRPPGREELERLRDLVGARAAEGRPPEEGLAVYRRAMRAGWQAVTEAADESERAALGSVFDLLLEWLDLVSRVFEQAYAEEQDALVTREERRARWLVERVAAGEEDGDTARVAEALGFVLAPSLRPFAAALAKGSGAQHLQLASSLRRQGVLACSEGRGVVGLAHAPLDADALGLAERLALAEGDAEPAPGLEAALGELRATVSLALAAGRRGAVRPEEFLPELLAAGSPRLADRLRSAVFGPLLAAGREDLCQTLEQLAAHGFERSAAAAALPVHRNTLAGRIEKLEELTGLDLDDPDDRGTVWLAARVCTVHSNEPEGWSPGRGTQSPAAVGFTP